jgi:hypothetical protein
MDEHRKTAIEVRAKIAKAVFEDNVSSRDIDEVEYKIIEDALRFTASKSEKDGWNRAVEECAKLVSSHWNNSEIMCNQHDQAYRSADAIRRLIREEGK